MDGTMRVTVAVLLAAAAALVLAVPPARSTPSSSPDNGGADLLPVARSTVVDELFNLSHADGRGYYAAFLADLDYHVNATAGRWIRRHPVLGRQQLRDPPATMFHITVTADPNDRVTFFVRSDNLYLAGFSNKHGSLFSFTGDQYKLPQSKLLSFGSGYPDFFGRRAGYHGLLRVLINRKEAVAHLRTLANYQAAAPDQGLKVPLAFFVLTLCEAERFAPLRKAVIKRWDGAARNIDDVLDHRSNTLLLDLVVNWRVFSCALLIELEQPRREPRCLETQPWSQ